MGVVDPYRNSARPITTQAELEQERDAIGTTKPSGVIFKTPAELAFWETIVTVVARSESCKERESAIKWADVLLEARRQRMGK